MIAIDPRNGKILQKFDLDHGRDAYVMATQSRLPPHTIFLGRHGRREMRKKEAFSLPSQWIAQIYINRVQGHRV